MVFDFDRVIERHGTGSTKWDSYPQEVLPLWVADMDFEAAPAVCRALRRRVDHGVFGYSLVPESLVQAICAYHWRRYSWRVEPEWLVFLPAAVPGLNLVCKAFARPGESIMTITPVYPPFLAAPRNQHRGLITVSALCREGRWHLPLEQMETAVTADTRVLLFCHPHNPFGRVWRRHELEAVTDFCERHDLVLCSDEIHSDLSLDGLEHVPAAMASASAAGRTVTITSPSKTYNIPGLNFAYAVVADSSLRRRLRAAGQGLLEYDYPNWFGTAAAEAAYREGAEWLAALLNYLRGNRDLLQGFLTERLPRIGISTVEATYLAWLDVRGAGLEDPARACLEAGVALSDGRAFGAPGYLRLNFGCRRANLAEALRRLEPVLK